MQNILGNFRLQLFLLIFLVTPLGAQLQVRITNMQEEEIKSVALGKPFLLEISLHNVSGAIQSPTIHNIEKFNGQRTGIFMTTINGKSTHKYVYTLRKDQLGSFVLGPISVTYNNQTYTAPAITISVTADQEQGASTKKDKKKKEKYHAFMKLSVDKKSVVIGQKVKATLRFYYDDSNILLQQVVQPDLKNIAVTTPTHPAGGTEYIDGKEYAFIEWTWNYYPKNEGLQTIPAYAAHYQINRSSKRNNLNFFFDFISPQIKKVHSNGIQLTVEPVPLKNNKPVDGVGNFVRIETKIKPHVIKEGEASVVTIELEGDAYFDSITHFKLQNLPPELKWYDSQSLVKNGQLVNYSIKQFEFIVQPTKVGSWEIPAQRFTFFDPDTGKHQTIETVPQFITVLSSGHSTACEKQTTSSMPDIPQEPQLLPLYPYNNETGEPQPFALMMFGWLLALPFLFEIITLIRARWNRYNMATAADQRHRKAFTNAQRLMNEAKTTNNKQQLYYIFMQLWSDRCRIPLAYINQEVMEQQLQNRGFSTEQQQAWNQFFSTLTAHTFGTHHTEDNSDIFDKAKEWLGILQQGGL